MLGEFELPQVQEIVTLERRSLAEHKPPGMQGSLLQNLGRRPLRLSLWGLMIGSQAQTFLQKLDNAFRAGAPLPFTWDIVADAKLEKVVMEDMRVQELAGKPERYAYVLLLREYIQPIAAEKAAAVDADVQTEGLDLTGGLISGLAALDTSFVTQLQHFSTSLTSIVHRLG